MLKTTGLEASHSGGGIIEIKNTDEQSLRASLSLLENGPPSLAQLAENVKITAPEKFDEYLSDELSEKSFASRAFDIETSVQWIKQGLL